MKLIEHLSCAESCGYKGEQDLSILIHSATGKVTKLQIEHKLNGNLARKKLLLADMIKESYTRKE